MRKSSIAGAFAFMIMAASTTANAAVKYDFTAFSTIPTSGIAFTSVSGSFTYIAPDFVTSDTFIDAADCSASDSVLGPIACASQEFAFDILGPPLNTLLAILFGVITPQDIVPPPEFPEPYFAYYFDPTAFSTIGVHDTVLFGAAQAAQLAVSEVPEISTWAMMLVGFAGLGFVGYRRAREPRGVRAARKSALVEICLLAGLAPRECRAERLIGEGRGTVSRPSGEGTCPFEVGTQGYRMACRPARRGPQFRPC
jgi:hypothetical protein